MSSMVTATADLPAPRWLHWWAVLTVVVTVPLLTLGAEVTTKKVGMVDKEPVRSPLHLVQLMQEAGGLASLTNKEGLGWVIEHGHRTVGWIVGVAAIILAAGLAIFDTRRWMRWMGLAALVGVSSQGVLGMLRIELQNRLGPDAGSTVALIHGCTAQLVLALLVSIAVWTSFAWQQVGELDAQRAASCRKGTLVLAGLIYLQMVFGAVMRHKELALGMRLHVLLAFAVVAAAVWVGGMVLHAGLAGTAGRRSVWLLGGLLSMQLLLGLETLLSKFAVRWPYTQERVEPVALAPDLIRSVHFLVGALTFSTVVALALWAHRHVLWHVRRTVLPARELECVA